MNETKQAFAAVAIGEAVVVRNLAVFPLIDKTAPPAPYLALPEALKAGFARITEVSQSGQVPRLQFVNTGELPVLLLDGEELVGCKQNRILNLTILAPAHSEIQIPVSCVEQGRWRFQTSHFESSNRAMFAELRAAKVAQVSENLASFDNPAADQGAIWDGIAQKSRRMGSDSDSGAMNGIYRRREADVEDYLAGIRPVGDQVGAVFSINGRPVGLELFDATTTCDKYLSKVTSGYALDAIDHFTRVHPVANEAAVRDFIGRVGEADERRFKSIGLGEDIRLHAPGLAGAGLVANDRLTHLCAFDLGEQARGDGRTRDYRFRRTLPVRPIGDDVE